jgi:HD domain
MSEVGTLAWARRTGGRMSRADRLHQVRDALLAQLALLPRPWRRSLAVDPSVALPAEAPTSEVARSAYEYAEEVSSPALLGHCMRTWLFGELGAACEGLAHDRELLYVASLLHDLGLTQPHMGADPRAHCFAVEGAFAAEDFLVSLEWPSEPTEAVTEAISLHLNIKVPADLHGPEAYLLNFGAGVDVVGRGLERLPAPLVEEIGTRHPRTGLAAELIDTMEAQRRARPQARLALMMRLGFRRYIERNPLETRESGTPATTQVSRTS